MKVLRARISNWKSFPYTDKPTWIDFSELNVIIGPNSHGKTNFANALRVLLLQHPDYGGGEGRVTICEFDCNNPQLPITIDLDLLMEDGTQLPLRHTHSFAEFNDLLKGNYLDLLEIKGKFFPLSTGRDLNRLGAHKSNKYSEDYNWELIEHKWDDIRRVMLKFFNVNLQEEAPQNSKSYLSEQKDEIGVPLLETGGGIKAVLFIVMEILKQESDCKVFLFEEPEIHMHSSLLRQLMKFFASLIEANGFQFFITTHSSILIDNAILPGKNPTVIQIKKENNKSRIIDLSNSIENKWDLVYNQLGYKPSDILLTNTVVWVEGPTESIYIRHWLAKLDETIEEGKDYSIMFYGGSLLAHLSYSRSELESFIALSKINVKSAIVMDSDRDNEEDGLSENKKRVIKTFEKGPGFVWVTDGREIENYVDLKTFELAVNRRHSRQETVYQIKSAEKYYNRTILKEKTATKDPVDIDKVRVALKVVEIHEERGSSDLVDTELRTRVQDLLNWIIEANN